MLLLTYCVDQLLIHFYQVLEGEKQAIQNELEKDIPQTGWKKFSILKLMSDPDHPFHRLILVNITLVNIHENM